MLGKLISELWYLILIVILMGVFSLFKAKIKGFVGEKTIAAFLTRLDKNKYKILNDVLMDVNGKSSQIDHVIVSNYGIFVIETKNYKGWIFGDEYGKYWTQVIYKRKEKFYNPVRQNYGHVQALKEVLKAYPNAKYIPIVVFGLESISWTQIS